MCLNFFVKPPRRFLDSCEIVNKFVFTFYTVIKALLENFSIWSRKIFKVSKKNSFNRGKYKYHLRPKAIF